MILAKSALWTGTVEGKNSSIPYRFTCIWSIIVKWQGVKRARAREGTMNRDIFCSCINLNQIHIQEKCGTSVGKELLYTHLIWIGIQPWQLCHLSFIAIRYIPDSRIPILKSLVLRFTHWGQILFEVAIEYLMFYHLHHWNCPRLLSMESTSWTWDNFNDVGVTYSRDIHEFFSNFYFIENFNAIFKRLWSHCAVPCWDSNGLQICTNHWFSHKVM